MKVYDSNQISEIPVTRRNSDLKNKSRPKARENSNYTPTKTFANPNRYSRCAPRVYTKCVNAVDRCPGITAKSSEPNEPGQTKPFPKGIFHTDNRNPPPFASTPFAHSASATKRGERGAALSNERIIPHQNPRETKEYTIIAKLLQNPRDNLLSCSFAARLLRPKTKKFSAPAITRSCGRLSRVRVNRPRCVAGKINAGAAPRTCTRSRRPAASLQNSIARARATGRSWRGHQGISLCGRPGGRGGGLELIKPVKRGRRSRDLPGSLIRKEPAEIAIALFSARLNE